ncbi:reverse transcriptase zinc-binding domain-containing protein [Artemisia annua]|uniref:Reverse transcriptase zinc-binding domain-containing protein n=1 Tax=Artemisia annua TaxID=35608 RepID=A0A2U1KF89_ARTAN|nr:reverse transcriptase zinc-binding domain-containing protein [Artemisia annua]
MRQEVYEYMVMQVGNGRKTSMWFDNWSSIGALSNFISYRELYNAKLNADTKVVDMIENGTWKWPTEWYDKFPLITQINVPTIDDTHDDQLKWKSKTGKIGNFSVS